MAARSVSPGGALLRASRVFAIPPQLPRSSGELSATAIFSSDTATLPHPVNLSITTPQASLKRGDWGFKRPLPLRSTTKTSTPFIRVKAIDTFEHITEFGSSADHAISLQKWQEMGIPLSTPVVKKNFSEFVSDEVRSVFEPELDSIAESDGGVLGKEDTRWKFKGPWLAGQTEGDFNAYLLGEVRKRKYEFQQYLRAACAKSLTMEARQAAPEEMAPAVEASQVTEEQFDDFVKNLRNTLTDLYKLIRSFLDLPPAPSARRPTDIASLMTSRPGDEIALPASQSPYAEGGPPKTHPSAGLAYSLTNAHTYNHPVFGPQRHQRPIPARVVMPKGSSTGSVGQVLGVGGFATNVPAGVGANSFNTNNMGKRNKNVKRDLIPGLVNIEPDKVGGSKTWVHPTHARVDTKGRVILSVDLADMESVAVHEGTTDQIPVEAAPAPRSTSAYDLRPRNSESRGEGRGYGLNLGSSASRPKLGRSAPTPGKQTDALSHLESLF